MSTENQYQKAARKKKHKIDGVIPPKYTVKIIEKNMRSASIRVYFGKNELITDLLEQWGKCDLIVQEFVI